MTKKRYWLPITKMRFFLAVHLVMMNSTQIMLKRRAELLVKQNLTDCQKNSRRGGRTVTGHFWGILINHAHPAIALGVLSFTDYEESDLDHFAFYSRIDKNLLSKNVAEMENQYLLQAVQQSSASIVITDLEGKIRYVNPKFEEVSGYSFEELRNQNPGF
ncbi:MAG: PAS domain S-box protein [Bacteroidetes bacterium]|nr:PAS domain S-box protein [Bacteroidota bacterium]